MWFYFSKTLNVRPLQVTEYFYSVLLPPQLVLHILFNIGGLELLVKFKPPNKDITCFIRSDNEIKISFYVTIDCVDTSKYLCGRHVNNFN